MNPDSFLIIHKRSNADKVGCMHQKFHQKTFDSKGRKMILKAEVINQVAEVLLVY